MEREGHNGGAVQPYRVWHNDVGTTLGKKGKSVPLNDQPIGFYLNSGKNYIPFQIHHHGHLITAKYVKVRGTMNAMVYGTMGKGENIYRGDVHAAPRHDLDEVPDYEHEDLKRLQDGFVLRRQVDRALESIDDRTLTAEVAWYREAARVAKEEMEAIHRMEDDLYCALETCRHSVKRLERANAIARIKRAMQDDRDMKKVTPWVFERGRSP